MLLYSYVKLYPILSTDISESDGEIKSHVGLMMITTMATILFDSRYCAAAVDVAAYRIASAR